MQYYATLIYVNFLFCSIKLELEEQNAHSLYVQHVQNLNQIKCIGYKHDKDTTEATLCTATLKSYILGDSNETKFNLINAPNVPILDSFTSIQTVNTGMMEKAQVPGENHRPLQK